MGNKSLFLLMAAVFGIFFCTASSAGNLKLIEKRLEELSQLNRQAVQEAGPIPQYGTVELEAHILPGAKAPVIPQQPGSGSSQIQEKRILIGKKSVHRIVQPTPFTIQISSGSSQTQCFRVANMLRRAGYPAFTASQPTHNNEILHRIFVGSFATQEEAKVTQQSLEKDQILETRITSLPYSVQIGRSGSNDSLKNLRDQVAALQYLAYTGYTQDMATKETHSRLLVGAFATREDADNMVYELRKAGLEARVTNR